MNVSFFISVKDIAVALRERDTSVGRPKMGAAVLSYTPWRCGPEWGPLVGLNNGHTLHLAQLAFTLKCCSYTEVTSERNDVRYDLHKWQKKEKHLSVTAAWSGIRRQPGKDEANDTPSVPCAHLLLPPFSDSTATTHPPHPHCASVHIRYCCWLHLDPGRMGRGGGDSCSLISHFSFNTIQPSRISQASRRHRSRNNLLKPQSRIDAPRRASPSSREFSRGLINGEESGGLACCEDSGADVEKHWKVQHQGRWSGKFQTGKPATVQWRVLSHQTWPGNVIPVNTSGTVWIFQLNMVGAEPAFIHTTVATVSIS